MPGDILLIEEGDRISADARLLEGAVEVDMSTLTGESVPVERAGRASADVHLPPLEARDLVFSGTACTGGEAQARRVRDRDEHRARPDRRAVASGSSASESPLERQVRRVAWLIAAVAVGVGLAFLPLGDARRRAAAVRRAQLRDRPDRRQRPRGPAARRSRWRWPSACARWRAAARSSSA